MVADGFTSHPLTRIPSFKHSSAIPLMPAPPIPTKCSRR